MKLIGFVVETTADASALDARIGEVVDTAQERLGEGWCVTLDWRGPIESGRVCFGVWAQAVSPATIASSQAWTQAYQLRDALRANVEPVVRAESAPDKLGTWASDTENLDWPLQRFGVTQARERFGVSGKDVRIGHPDTGIARHTSISDATWARILHDQGYDFIDRDDGQGPWDEARGFGQNEGHGTGTSSVILSEGDPNAAFRTVFGVAPGSQLIPYRVANSVVLVWPSQRENLAQAIERAVDKGCEVISISMGWAWGGRRLRKAVRYAYDKGVIVVAAAGQTGRGLPPPFVIAPARFPEVIGAAACHIDSTPCDWSARGGLVDVVAPGDGVWRAGWGQGGAIVSRSWGTSYATAHVAGVAALWIERWRTDPRFEARTGSARVELFRESLQAAAFRQPAGGKRGQWGCGVVDAEALLSVPPPPIDERVRASRPSIPSPEDAELLEELALLAREHTTPLSWAPGELAAALDRALAGPGRTDSIEGELDQFGPELVEHLQSNHAALQALVDRVLDIRNKVRSTSSADQDVLQGTSPLLKQAFGFTRA